MRRLLTLESRWTVLIVSAAMFMAQLDGAVLVIALPQMAAHFGRPAVSLSLAISIYLTMIVAILPISGWAADRFGAKQVFLSAIAGFAVFSLACALSTSFWWFIASRAMQGASAALLLPVGRLLMLRETPKEELVDALAITTMPMLIAPTFGPSIGGLIVDYGRWEYVFLLNLPVALSLFLVAIFRIAPTPADTSRSLDAKGAVLLSGGLVSMLTGFDRLGGGFDRLAPWLLIGGGVALLVGALWHVQRFPRPIVKLDALRSPAFRTTVAGAGALVRLPGRALIFALPLMFQVGFGLSPFVSGLLLIALNGGDLFAKPWIKPGFDRFGYRRTVVAGSMLGIAAFVSFVLIEQGPLLLPLLAVTLLMAGVSRSLVFTGMTSLTFVTLDKETMNTGNVLSSISMQLFNALSVSITAVLLSAFARAGGRSEAAIGDYRLTLLAIGAMGLAATLRLWKQLPHNLHMADVREPTGPPSTPFQTRG